MIAWAIATAGGFFSGAVMYSYFIPLWLRGVDVRRGTDDGNPGSSNAIRAVGVRMGLICMALDVAKAFLPVFIAVHLLYISGWLVVPVAAAPVLGHAFSPFLRFRGGKAVSTAFGALLGLLPATWVVLLLAVVMAVFRFIIVVRPDSLEVIVSFFVTSAIAFEFGQPGEYMAALALTGIIVSVKMILMPNAGDVGVSVGHYALTWSDNHLHFGRT